MNKNIIAEFIKAVTTIYDEPIRFSINGKVHTKIKKHAIAHAKGFGRKLGGGGISQFEVNNLARFLYLSKNLPVPVSDVFFILPKPKKYVPRRFDFLKLQHNYAIENITNFILLNNLQINGETFFEKQLLDLSFSNLVNSFYIYKKSLRQGINLNILRGGQNPAISCTAKLIKSVEFFHILKTLIIAGIIFGLLIKVNKGHFFILKKATERKAKNIWKAIKKHVCGCI